MKRWFYYVTSVFLAFVILMSGETTRVLAREGGSGSAREVDTSITNLVIQNASHETVSEMTIGGGFYINMDWKTKPGEIVHKDDYFDIQVPDVINLRHPATVKEFDLQNASGVSIAHATVNPNSDGGGTIHVVFNENADNQYDISGKISLYAYFQQSKITVNTTTPISVNINGTVVTTNIHVKPNPSLHELLGKWGEKTNQPDIVKWNMRINQQGSNLTNLKISDALQTDNGEYITDVAEYPFKLQEVTYREDAIIAHWGDVVDLSDKLTVAPDRRSFELNLGDIGTKQYILFYYSTLTSGPGSTQKNHAGLTADEVSPITINATYKDKGGGGSATGSLANRIKIIKVDAEDNTRVLSGAKFKVTKPDGTTFELGPTAADGTVVSSVLPQGAYKVKEIDAPIGYDLSDQEYTFNVTAAGGAIQTITNEPIKTSVQVKKFWVGPKGSAVTVKLLADGTEVAGKSVTLSEDNGWSASFDGLPKYSDNGTEIAYTVTEDQVSGVDTANYTTSVTGDAALGFTITNTNVETVSIEGVKTWDDDDNRDGIRPESITIHLLADGTEVSSTTVTADDGWSWLFDGQLKYASDGHKIAYTVTEDAVPNYSTTIDGFNVKNSYTPGKTSVTASKTWDDADNQDGIRPESVKVQLYANDVASGDIVELSAANLWTYTWTNLHMKDSGQNIIYTVKEVDVPDGYAATVAGDAVTGFTVTNTHEPKVISVPVTKKWVGHKGDAVTIHLLADGIDTGKTLILSSDNDWAGSFADLAQYKDGHAITYTVTEDAVEGYTSEISGDATEGFSITNTEQPKHPNKPKSSKPNKSHPSHKSHSRLPQTGDVSAEPASLLMGAFAVLAAGLLARRKMESSSDRVRHPNR